QVPRVQRQVQLAALRADDERRGGRSAQQMVRAGIDQRLKTGGKKQDDRDRRDQQHRLEPLEPQITPREIEAVSHATHPALAASLEDSTTWPAAAQSSTSTTR